MQLILYISVLLLTISSLKIKELNRDVQIDGLIFYECYRFNLLGDDQEITFPIPKQLAEHVINFDLFTDKPSVHLKSQKVQCAE